MSNINVVSVFFVSFAVFVGGTINGADDSLTAEEILEKSQQAMGVAAHYRIVTQEMGMEIAMEMSIYQKPLPDGSIAMLTDMSTPIKKTTAMYGAKSYDLYLKEKIAVDTSALSSEVQSIPGVAQLLSVAKDTQASLNLTRTFTDNGKEYYEIEQIMPIPAELLANLPPEIAKSMPAKDRFVIDAETFLIHEHETFASDGSRLSSLRYLGFEPMPDLTDDIFQVPAGFVILSPTSTQEYAMLTATLFDPDPGDSMLPPLVPPPIDPALLSPPDRFATDDEIYLPPDKVRNRTAMVLVVNIVVIAIIAALYLWHRRRKKEE